MCAKKQHSLLLAPVIYGSHCNTFVCEMPGLPYPLNKYHGEIQGHAVIVDAEGKILAHLDKTEGEGFITADATLGCIETTEAIPNKYCLRDRTLLAAFSWHHTGFVTRRWYKKHVRNQNSSANQLVQARQNITS